MVINEPGQWDVMISYTTRNLVSVALAEKIRAGLQERGLSVWMDVWMKNRHPQAMREGVENSDRIIAIISGDKSSGDSASSLLAQWNSLELAAPLWM